MIVFFFVKDIYEGSNTSKAKYVAWLWGPGGILNGTPRHQRKQVQGDINVLHIHDCGEVGQISLAGSVLSSENSQVMIFREQTHPSLPASLPQTLTSKVTLDGFSKKTGA